METFKIQLKGRDPRNPSTVIELETNALRDPSGIEAQGSQHLAGPYDVSHQMGQQWVIAVLCDIMRNPNQKATIVDARAACYKPSQLKDIGSMKTPVCIWADNQKSHVEFNKEKIRSVSSEDCSRVA
jgi:hypothetical protein